jgi:hypothetical protein
MAVSPFITPSSQQIRIKDVQSGKPVSEATARKIGSSINYLIQRTFNEIQIKHDGYFSNGNLYKSAPIRIPNIADITYYSLSVLDSGNGGLDKNAINFEVYDASGLFVNNLFGSGANQCFISGDNGANVLIGRDVLNASVFDVNTASHTIQYGNLNLTTLQAGYLLVPFVEDFANSARSINFTLRIQEQ